MKDLILIITKFSLVWMKEIKIVVKNYKFKISVKRSRIIKNFLIS
jgi:hypothetical protein